MCNYCDCENADKCSIVGNIPIGFCCPQCMYYEGETTCRRLREQTEARIQSKQKDIKALQSILGKSEKKITKKQLENFP